MAKTREVKSEPKKILSTLKRRIKINKNITGIELKTTISKKRNKLSLSLNITSLILFMGERIYKIPKPLLQAQIPPISVSGVCLALAFGWRF
jgi:hypothetical protein